MIAGPQNPLAEHSSFFYDDEPRANIIENAHRANAERPGGAMNIRAVCIPSSRSCPL